MTVTYCLLDYKDRPEKYDAACQPGNDAYDLDLFDYIGDGVVYSVSGRRYTGETRLSFYREKRNEN